MAYYETINLVAGDTKPEINLTLKDSNTAASGQTLDEDDSTTWIKPFNSTSLPSKISFYLSSVDESYNR